MIGLIPDPMRFTARALEDMGALVEVRSDGAAAVLPAALARDLDVSDALDLDPRGGEGAVACGIGSPLLDALVERGRAGLHVAAIRTGGDPPAEKAARALASAYVVRNGVASVTSIDVDETWYAQAAIGWSVEADERHEGRVVVSVHPVDGALPSLDPGSDVVLEEAAPEAAPELDRSAVTAWLARVGPTRVAPAVAPIVAVCTRRHERDHRRVAGYYGTLIAEARHPRRKVDPEAIAAKVRHLHAERDRRLADLRDRYEAKVSARVIAFLWVAVPVRVVTLRARRRKGDRDLVLRLPRGARAFDHLPCAGCDGWTGRPALCDDRLHVLCERCVPEATGRPACKACRTGAS